MAWPSGKAEACKASIPSSNLGATLVSFASVTLLYLIATPIGNLKDITFRAIEILNSCDYILCEDTRHSQILLQHYQINKPLKSFHKFSEASKEDSIISDLQKGQTIGVISDAGTPGISDPGARLVQKCAELDIPITSIPGPCAAISALTSSGLETDRFQFFGFLPKKKEDLRQTISEFLRFPGTSICYESPKRLIETLEEIHAMAPDRKVVVARELTKKFEEIKRGKAQELLDYWQTNPLKGEVVLMIEGKAEAINWASLTPEEHVNWLINSYGMSKHDAIKMAAEMRGVPKRTIYNTLLEE